MNIINLTPHTINIYGEDKKPIVAIQPSGIVARVTVTRQLNQTIDGIPCYSTAYGNVVGLPDAQDGDIYIVSGLVRAAVPHRHEVFQPGELLRDADGQPIGCIGLQQ